jgi:hypothetical protein
MPELNRYPQFLRRPQASAYLLEVWGLEYSAATLARLCSQGRGPETHRDGKRALHTPQALNQWAKSRIRGRTAPLTDDAAIAVTAPRSTALPPITPTNGEWRPTP